MAASRKVSLPQMTLEISTRARKCQKLLLRSFSLIVKRLGLRYAASFYS